MSFCGKMNFFLYIKSHWVFFISIDVDFESNWLGLHLNCVGVILDVW